MKESGAQCATRLSLISLYINYITENVQGAKMLFADDTNLLISVKDEFDLQHKVIDVMKELEI
jgi:hypothetical protein